LEPYTDINMNKRCWPVYNLLGQGNTLDFVTISVVLYKMVVAKLMEKVEIYWTSINCQQRKFSWIYTKNRYKRYTTVLWDWCLWSLHLW